MSFRSVSFAVLSLTQERDEWVAELRVASRVVPLEDIFELKGLLRKGAFASVSDMGYIHQYSSAGPP